ncbi:unnamed protein product [Adineta steineri]|uniref:Uncharacterized protein n=1 Tax=Adineta steineri TaxID=433720 RepID=A0A819UKV9_9BILA|nr:unnamed protein product [Adineta steineri]CAF4093983.1 unnamed protein product [Adineta steineri]
MIFRRVQTKHRTLHKPPGTLVAPSFVVVGKPLTALKPILLEEISITTSDVSNKRSYATSHHKLDSVHRSLQTSPVTSTNSPRRNPALKGKVSAKSKNRTPRDKKRTPPSVIGTKNGKKVSFVKTIDTSSTLTPEIGGGSKEIRIVTRCTPGTTHVSVNGQKHSKDLLPQHVRSVSLISNTNTPLLPAKDRLTLLSLGIDPTNMFTDPKKCINFVKEKTNEIILLVISNDLAQTTIRDIHPLRQVHTIYILGEKTPKNKLWIKSWSKIKGIYPAIQSFCEILKYDIQQHRRDSITTGMSNVELEYLDVSFMYTKLLTEILFEIPYDDRAKQALAQFCREYCDIRDLEKIAKFERDYVSYKSIWWYTRESFVYKMINRALRKQDIYIIIKAGFFIRDLQKEIEARYKPPTEKMIVHRGQALSEMDFNQLCERKGGLYSFNNFLSTSMRFNVSNLFGEGCPQNHEIVGILFEIEIDPTIFTPTHWAWIASESRYPEEEEVLFAMHSIFRINEIEKLDDRYWKVQLSLTSDNDPELKKMTEFIREATKGSSGWDRLGKFLLQIGKFSKAEEIFQMLIENTTEDDESSLGHRYHMLGSLNEQGKGDYENALIFYNKALNIYLQYPDSNNFDLITIYNDIGEMYIHSEDYSKALGSFQMALDIQKDKYRAYDVAFTRTYKNMAETYEYLKQYSEALQFYQRLLSIQKKAVPRNETDLCETYSNIGKIYLHTGKSSKALQLFYKVGKWQQRNRSSSNIDKAINDIHIGQANEKLEDYSMALSYYEKALGILSQLYSSNIAELTNTYDNIARVYKNMNENTKALHFYKKVQYNLERHPQVKHPNLGIVYFSMGQIYQNIQESEEAAVSYRQAILFEKSRMFPDNSKLLQYRKHLTEVRTTQ